MKRLLRYYVSNDLFNKTNLPDPSNRRFYPSINVIRSHMVAARKKLQLSMIDQECLLMKKEKWEKEDPTVKIFFRPKTNEPVDNKSELQDSGDDMTAMNNPI